MLSGALIGGIMNCPKCSAETCEKSGKTWVCYACMHIWMDKPTVKIQGPQCDCGKLASYLFLADGNWNLICKACMLNLAEHMSVSDRKRTTFELSPNSFDYFHKELLTEE